MSITQRADNGSGAGTPHVVRATVRVARALTNATSVLASAVLCLLLFVISSSDTLASHGRGGTLSWTQGGGNTINFSFNTAWRRDFPWAEGYSAPGPNVGQTVTIGAFNYGDGNVVSLVATVNAVDAANNIIFTTWTSSHTYASAGNVTASFSSCCRLSTLQGGNADANYNF